ncbi:hypothetical protein SSX86_007914 [Deinandra increscens subsp. villosa]|uniref:Uncharacterized protein n=1 Tax=Deinandra increscens subsp. villosa TaxID=3103831 RepID=A0AAP0H8D8_9ASTR
MSISKVATLLRQGKKALPDLELLKILQTEIRHHLYNKNELTETLGDFVVDWSWPDDNNVTLRRKCESGEEIGVIAFVGQGTFVKGSLYPDIMVLIRKNGLRAPALLFDCTVLDEGKNKIDDFRIQNAHYLKSGGWISSAYKAPVFSKLNPTLQQELKQYLISRGISNSLFAFLLHHIHHKEQDMYLKWLQKLEAMVMAET